MSHVICHDIINISQLKLLLMKLYSYFDLNMQKYQLKHNINYDINNQHCSYIFLIFIVSNLIKMNGKVCTIRRYLCHNIKKPMSYHIMKLYVTTIMASLTPTVLEYLCSNFFHGHTDYLLAVGILIHLSVAAHEFMFAAVCKLTWSHAH